MDRDSLNKICEVSGELGKAMMVIEARNQEIQDKAQQINELTDTLRRMGESEDRAAERINHLLTRVQELENKLSVITEP